MRKSIDLDYFHEALASDAKELLGAKVAAIHTDEFELIIFFNNGLCLRAGGHTEEGSALSIEIEPS